MLNELPERAHLSFCKGSSVPFSPLTPALSPLRGEGARRALLVKATLIAARTASWCSCEKLGCTEDAATGKRITARIQRDSLSPQRGEGRGEG